MKKIITAFILFIGLAVSAHADNYAEGIEYLKVSQPTHTGDKIEVLEFFWYGCSHCYTFEPHVQKWLKTKPDNVEFVRVPAVFRPSWKVHGRTYYALEIMGITEEMHTKIFSAMHNKKLKLKTVEAMAKFLARQKVDKKKFLEAYNSFAVENMLRKAIKKLKNYKVQGVPAVAVNGKYYITGSTAGSYERLIDIVNHFIKKETANK